MYILLPLVKIKLPIRCLLLSLRNREPRLRRTGKRELSVSSKRRIAKKKNKNRNKEERKGRERKNGSVKGNPSEPDAI